MTDDRTTLAMLSEQLADAVATAGAALVAVHARPRLPSTGVHWKDGVVVTTEGTISAPSGPNITCSSAASLVTLENTMSTPAASCFAVTATFAPPCSKGRVRSGVRL